MAVILWEELRERARERADQKTQQATKAFITDTELDRRLNESCSAFHNRILELQRHEWSIVPAKECAVSLIAGTSLYLLPAEAMAVKAARVSDGNWSEPVIPYDHSERWQYEGVDAGWYESMRWRYRYRVIGKELRILPTPTSPLTLTVDYLPDWEEKTTGQSLVFPYGWWLWPVLHCAMGMVSKRFPDQPPVALAAEFNAEDARIMALAGRRVTRALAVRGARDDTFEDDWPDFSEMWPS